MARKSKVRTVRSGCDEGVKQTKHSHKLVNNVRRVVDRTQRSRKSVGRHRVQRRTKRLVVDSAQWCHKSAGRYRDPRRKQHRAFRKSVRCAKGGVASDGTVLDMSNTKNKDRLIREINNLTNDAVVKELNIANNKLNSHQFIQVIGAISTMQKLEKLNMSNNEAYSDGGKHIAKALNGKNDLTELNLAGNGLGLAKKYGKADSSGVIAFLSEAIPTMTALTSLNISHNSLATGETGKAITEALNDNSVLTELDLSYNYNARVEEGENVQFAVKLADCIKKNGPLEKLLLAGNRLATKEGGKALATALAANTVLKELDVSGNNWNYYGEYMRNGAIFAKELAVGLSTSKITSLDISNNQLVGTKGTGKKIKLEGEDLDWAQSHHKSEFEEITECDHSGLIALANVIKDTTALTSLNISSNNIGELVLPAGWSENKPGWIGPQDVYRDAAEGPPPDSTPDGVIALAGAIQTNKSLVKLTVGNNSLQRETAGNVFGNAIVGVTELDLSCPTNNWEDEKPCDTAFVTQLAAHIGANNAITSLNLSNNNIGQLVGWISQESQWRKEPHSYSKYVHSDGREQNDHPGTVGPTPVGAIAIAQAITSMKALTSLDISKNNIGQIVGWALSADYDEERPERYDKYKHTDGRSQNEKPTEMGKSEGFIALANAIRANKALATVNIMGNMIRKEQLSELQVNMKAHPTLVSLCGIADDATEANLSGLGMDAYDAVVLANELPAKGALTRLNLSKNRINYDLNDEAAAATGKALADALAVNTVLQELDLSSNYLDQSFAEAFAVGLSANGALTSLNISNNNLTDEDIKKKITQTNMQLRIQS